MIMTHGHEHAGKNRYLMPSTLFASQNFYQEAHSLVTWTIYTWREEGASERLLQAMIGRWRSRDDHSYERFFRKSHSGFAASSGGRTSCPYLELTEVQLGDIIDQPGRADPIFYFPLRRRH